MFFNVRIAHIFRKEPNVATMADGSWDTRTQRAATERALAKQSFCVLATGSAMKVPHSAGVLYQWVDGRLFASTATGSVKARNVRESGRAAVTVPVRRAPMIPPSCVQFQGAARLLDTDDPEIRALVAAGRLKRITSHGELDLPDGCFIEVIPHGRLSTYGIGMSLLTFLRHPLEAARSVEVVPILAGGAA